MKHLAQLDRDEARHIEGLLFDLDDTVLSHGVLSREAYSALWDLHDAGLRLIAVTGRPTSWGEFIVKQWPIDGAVTESGAIRIVRDGHTILRIDPCSTDERCARRARLGQIVSQLNHIVPEAKLADDIGGRAADVAWDVSELVTLPEDRIALIVRCIADAGARSTRSSIHVHATFDTDDKASGVVDLLSRQFGVDEGKAVARYAFVGDSMNDSACFSAFRLTFGVSNVRKYVSKLSIPPRYIASKPMGAGFVEVAKALLAFR